MIEFAVAGLLSLGFVAGVADAQNITVASGDAGVYKFLGLKANLDPQKKLGSKRAGKLCIPNGSLRFKDVWPSNKDETTAQITSILGQAGLHMTVASDQLSSDADTSEDFRIAAEVKGLSVSGCARNWGLGNRGLSQASGEIRIIWRIYSVRHKEILFAVETTNKFEHTTDKASGENDVLTSAMGASVPDMVQLWKTQQRH